MHPAARGNLLGGASQNVRQDLELNERAPGDVAISGDIEDDVLVLCGVTTKRPTDMEADLEHRPGLAGDRDQRGTDVVWI